MAMASLSCSTISLNSNSSSPLVIALFSRFDGGYHYVFTFLFLLHLFPDQSLMSSTLGTQNALVIRPPHLPTHAEPNSPPIHTFLVEIREIDSRQNIIIQNNGYLHVRLSECHQLLQILENSPWSFRGWFLAIDKLSDSHLPKFLSRISLWIKILNVPSNFRFPAILEEIATVISEAHRVRVRTKQPTKQAPGEYWVRVHMNITSKLKFVTSILFGENVEPTHLQLVFPRLRHFCTICGSILHLPFACNIAQPEQHQNLGEKIHANVNDQEIRQGNIDNQSVNSPENIAAPSFQTEVGINIQNLQPSLLEQSIPLHGIGPSSSSFAQTRTRGMTISNFSYNSSIACAQIGPTKSMGVIQPCNINLPGFARSNCPLNSYICSLAHLPNRNGPYITTLQHNSPFSLVCGVSFEMGNSPDHSNSDSSSLSPQILCNISDSAEAALENTLYHSSSSNSSLQNLHTIRVIAEVSLEDALADFRSYTARYSGDTMNPQLYDGHNDFSPSCITMSPFSIFYRIFPGKYFPNKHILMTTTRRRTSFEWKRVCEEASLKKNILKSNTPGSDSSSGSPRRRHVIAHYLRNSKNKAQTVPTSVIPIQKQFLKYIWQISLPPKLKHFWWQIAHPVLRTMVNLCHKDFRHPIPFIIRHAIMDKSQEKSYSTRVSTSSVLSKTPSPCSKSFCLTDFSWISSNDCFGSGWVLKDHHNHTIQGQGSSNHIADATQAEAFALREAVYRLHAFGYQDITFLGDSKMVYETPALHPLSRGYSHLEHNMALIEDISIVAGNITSALTSSISQ